MTPMAAFRGGVNYLVSESWMGAAGCSLLCSLKQHLNPSVPDQVGPILTHKTENDFFVVVVFSTNPLYLLKDHEAESL